MLLTKANPYCARDKLVLARIALNALVDPYAFPVDLSEIRALKIETRLLAQAFLAYMATNPEEYGTWTRERCKDFFDEIANAEHGVARSIVDLDRQSCM